MLCALPIFAALTLLAAPQTPTQQPTPVQTDTNPAAQAPKYPVAPYHLGGDVHPPVLIHHVDPQFSEQARRARFSGQVQVYLWVDTEGIPSHLRVVRGVGMGLDEEAIKAIRQYRFKPATLNGEPVTVDLYITVTFIMKN